MKKFIIILTIAISAFLLSSCVTTKGMAYAKMYEEKPLVMLIMPPINNSSAADAKDYFYTTMNVPIAEAGYYVIPPMTAMAAMQSEGAYDSEGFIDGDLEKFRIFFGADVAVFTIIKLWNKSIASTTIKIEYIFRSTKTNEVLFHRDATITYRPQGNGGGDLISLLIQSIMNVVANAVADYVVIAQSGNVAALWDLPYGKYHHKYGTDADKMASPLKFSTPTNPSWAYYP